MTRRVIVWRSFNDLEMLDKTRTDERMENQQFLVSKIRLAMNSL